VDRRHRDEQLRVVVQQFADRLAHHVRIAPYNWFNFYDFWNDPTAGSGSAGPGNPDDQRS
jgi:predicted LPLAT superfamily acyltransferase